MIVAARIGAALSGGDRWLPIAALTALSAAFIARVRFVVGGETFFSLFDDQLISMGYARNLAEGHGLVWNAGEAPVEGYTNLLWTLWMAVLHALGPPVSKASLLVMVSGAVILLLHVVVVRRIVEEIAPRARLAGAVACWLVALDHSLAYWTLRGFEVGLVALEISVAVFLAIKLVREPSGRKLGGLAAVMALGVLTRDDTLIAWLVVGAYVGVCSGRDRRMRHVIVLAGAALGALAGHTVFRVVYYGDPLPNTYYLKLHAIPVVARWRRGAGALARVAVGCLPVPLALAGSLLARGWGGSAGGEGAEAGARGAGRAEMGLLAGLFLAHCAYSVHVGGDILEGVLLVNRFVTCGLPSLFILAGLGLDRVVGSLRARGRLLRTGGAVATLLVVAAQGPALVRWARSNALFSDADALGARYGLALGAATGPEARIAVTWAGAIPYFSRRRSIDLFGVCDATVARGAPRPGPHAPGHNKWDLAYSVGELRPDVIANLVTDGAEVVGELEAWGYERIGPDVFYRRGSQAVDPAAIRRAACAVPWGSDELWGYVGDSREAWEEKWKRECLSAP